MGQLRLTLVALPGVIAERSDSDTHAKPEVAAHVDENEGAHNEADVSTANPSDAPVRGESGRLRRRDRDGATDGKPAARRSSSTAEAARRSGCRRCRMAEQSADPIERAVRKREVRERAALIALDDAGVE